MTKPTFGELLVRDSLNATTAEQYAQTCRNEFRPEGGAVVIIAAHNEEQQLPLTLTALARQTIEVSPVVVSNASTDNTAEIAEKFGARVLEEPIPGKLKALQTGLEKVCEGGIPDTVLLTDADTLPVQGWAARMAISHATLDNPEIVTGVAAYKGADTAKQFALNTLRLGYANAKNVLRIIQSLPPITRGFNTAVSMRRPVVLEGILELPNYFPGEDIAIRDEILKNGGQARADLSLRSTVFTSGDRYQTVSAVARRLKHGVGIQAQLYPEYGALASNLYISPFDQRTA